MLADEEVPHAAEVSVVDLHNVSCRTKNQPVYFLAKLKRKLLEGEAGVAHCYVRFVTSVRARARNKDLTK